MRTSALDAKPAITPALEEYYAQISEASAAPLWQVLRDIVTPEPSSVCRPAIWRYQELRAMLMKAGALISASDAERRVLILENPALAGLSRTTHSLFAGLQLVLPGEIAASHRHTASALRFLIEGEGAFTAVDRERITMRPGDFVVTPSWTYHDHGNPGNDPVFWLDGLDIPIVNLLETCFSNRYGEEQQPLARPEGDSLARFGAHMLPVTPTRGGLFAYPYSLTRTALKTLRENGPLHPCHGVKLLYINPATGKSPMPSIGAFAQLLPAGFRGKSYRATDATVYCVVEGSGQSHIGDNSFAWKEHDIFVAPSWFPVSHDAEQDSVIFSFSDRPLQQYLSLWREEELA